MTPSHLRCYRPALVLVLALVASCQARLDLSSVHTQQAQSVQRADLLQAAAAHEGTIVAVGAMGVIITSEDGGTSWLRTTVAEKPFFLDVSVCPAGDFHAIDNVGVLWSRQSDNSWSPARLPEGEEPQALTCDPSGTLWVVGGFGTILSSEDAGNSWDRYSLDEDVYLTTVQFVDAERGFVTGEFGVVLYTGDRGSTWQRAQDLPDNFYAQAARFIDESTGWVVGLNGTIWYTNDRAQSWHQESNGNNAPLYGIVTVGDAVVAVGDNATVLYRRTSASSWTELDSSVGTRMYLRAIVDLGGRQFAAGGGGVLFTGILP
ncbi:MAG: WD40/YVTN/BNR-like repeat-containing protein [Woeseiaceae bacterium]